MLIECGKHRCVLIPTLLQADCAADDTSGLPSWGALAAPRAIVAHYTKVISFNLCPVHANCVSSGVFPWHGFVCGPARLSYVPTFQGCRLDYVPIACSAKALACAPITAPKSLRCAHGLRAPPCSLGRPASAWPGGAGKHEGRLGMRRGAAVAALRSRGAGSSRVHLKLGAVLG